MGLVLGKQVAVNVTQDGAALFMPSASGEQEASEHYHKVSELASADKENSRQWNGPHVGPGGQAPLAGLQRRGTAQTGAGERQGIPVRHLEIGRQPQGRECRRILLQRF